MTAREKERLRRRKITRTLEEIQHICNLPGGRSCDRATTLTRAAAKIKKNQQLRQRLHEIQQDNAELRARIARRNTRASVTGTGTGTTSDCCSTTNTNNAVVIPKRESQRTFPLFNLHTMYSLSMCAMSILTPTCDILDMNRAFAEMIQLPSQIGTVPRLNCKKLTPEEDLGEVNSMMTPLIRGTRDTATIVKGMYTVRGQKFRVHTYVSVVRDSNGAIKNIYMHMLPVSDPIVSLQTLS
jgi:PAS domain-containing protein